MAVNVIRIVVVPARHLVPPYVFFYISAITSTLIAHLDPTRGASRQVRLLHGIRRSRFSPTVCTLIRMGVFLSVLSALSFDHLMLGAACCTVFSVFMAQLMSLPVSVSSLFIPSRHFT